MDYLRIKGIIIQNLFHLRHSLEEVFDTLFWSSMDVVIWSFMTTYLAGQRGLAAGITVFLMGGLILWNIVWRAQQDIAI
ncbi:MAG: ABC transporter permease, partial [Candidatus Wildermuthbacteria bacterium]|nr:ABC transporter permease [Candidatus Wildermuthbacteria bacterium]